MRQGVKRKKTTVKWLYLSGIFKFIPRKTSTDFNKYNDIYIPRRNYFLT